MTKVVRLSVLKSLTVPSENCSCTFSAAELATEMGGYVAASPALHNKRVLAYTDPESIPIKQEVQMLCIWRMSNMSYRRAAHTVAFVLGRVAGSSCSTPNLHPSKTKALRDASLTSAC